MSDRDTPEEAAANRTVDALADAADAEAIGGEARPIPSFAAVMARAHRIDPERVPSTHVDQAQRSGAPTPPVDPDAFVNTLILAARADAEASIEARRHRAAPRLVDPGAHRRVTTAVVATVGGLLTAAAAVSLALSLRGDAIDRAAQDRDSSSLAAAQAAVEDTGGQANVPPAAEPAPARRRTPAGTRRPEHAPLEQLDPTSPLAPPPLEVPPQPGSFDASGSTDADPEPDVVSPETDRPARKPPRHARSIAKLDAKARDALAAGNLSEADAALARLIQHGGKSRLAEAAFGDRFAIAHRLHGAAAQRKLWRSYLQRFPRGRFADDARAGLCRRAPKNADECWQRYLDDFSTGAYRAQAKRALADEP